MINETVKRLRAHGDRFYKAADIIEKLLTSDPLDNPKAARAIEREVAKNMADDFVTGARGRGRPLGSKNKRKTYNGTHWMQQPENKTRVSELARARGMARRGVVEEPVPVEPVPVVPVVATVSETPKKKRHHTGLHWTQKPEFASKLKGMHRKMMLAKKRAKKEKS